MISGALILNRNNSNIKNFFKKRIKRLFTPYIPWVIIYFILGITVIHDMWGMFYYDTPASLSIEYFLGVFFSMSEFSSVLWFIWCILGFYLVVPILDSFIKDYEMKGLEYILIISIICAIIPTLCLEDSVISNRLEFIKPFFLCYLYPILGYYLHKKEFNISEKYLFLLGIALLIIGYVLSLNSMYVQGINDLSIKLLDTNSLYVISQAIGLFLIFKYANVKMISSRLKPVKETFLSRLIVSLSICSFGMYFVHWVIIYYMHNQQFFIQFTIGKAYYWIPIFGIGLVISSWIIVLIISKIPILKWLSGV